MSDVRFAVRRMLSEGWAPVPIAPGEKGPRTANWQHTDFKETDFQEDSNVGVRLGKPSGGLVDLDLDCMEAIELAPKFLPSTQRIAGRAAKPQSHYFYICPDTQPKAYKDGDNNMLLEVRSTGQQTVLPSSVHPSGETYVWEADREPSKVEQALLLDAAKYLATAVLLARVWPANGATTPQHDLAGYVGGFLAARQVPAMIVALIVREAATLARDSDVRDRETFARQTVDRFGDGTKPIAGGPKLAEIVGEKNLKRLTEWYGGNAALAHEPLVEEMNKRHFVVTVGKDTVYGTEDSESVVFQTRHALVEWYANQRIVVGEKELSRGPRKGETEEIMRTKFDVWREHPQRRQYRMVTFAPPPRSASEDVFNTWRGLAVEPAPGDCSLFLGHILNNLCSGNRDHFKYLMDWLAFTVQQPGVPIEVAVVLKGEMGTGKGIFANTIGSLFGRHYVQVEKPEQLTGKFNAALSSKIVVFADEAFFAGDKSHLGALKRIITEPTVQIEPKGIDSYTEPNCMHLIMATNEHWSVPAGFNERRFFILDVASEKRQNLEYFGAIVDQMHNGGRAALLDLLLKRQVTHNDVRKVPLTQELRIQQEYTMAPELKWWKICLHQGMIGNMGWPDRVRMTEVYDVYLDWCDRLDVKRKVTVIDFSRRVLGPWLGRVTTNAQGQRVRVLVSLEEARTLFDKRAGVSTPWHDDDLETGPNVNDIPF